MQEKTARNQTGTILPAVSANYPFPILSHGMVKTDDLCRMSIPKRLREKFHLLPDSQIHFATVDGMVLLATDEQANKLGGKFHSTKLDELGRLVIPVQFRTLLAVTAYSQLQLVQRAGLPYLFLKPYYPEADILAHITAAQAICQLYERSDATRDMAFEISGHLKAITDLLQQNVTKA